VDPSFWSTVVRWTGAHPAWGVAFAFLVACTETLAFVGYAVPGLALLFALGILVGGGALPLVPVVAAAALGAMAGDVASYFLGRRYGERLLRWGPIARRAALTRRGRDFCERHGAKSVFLGRFVGFVRPLVPVLMGVGGLSPGAFLLSDVPAALLWAPLYLFPGYAVGAALGYAAQGAVRLVLLAAVAAALFYLAFRLLRGWATAASGVLRRGFDASARGLRRMLGGLVSEISVAHPGERGLLFWGFCVVYGFVWLIVALVRRIERHRHPGLVELLVPHVQAAGTTATLARAASLLVAPPVWIGLVLTAAVVAAVRGERATVRVLALAGFSALVFDFLLVPAVLGTGVGVGHLPPSLFGPVVVAWTLGGVLEGNTGHGRLARWALGVATVAGAAGAVLVRAIWLSAAVGSALLGLAWGAVLVHAQRRHGGRRQPPAPVVLVALVLWVGAFGWGLLVHPPAAPAPVRMSLGGWWARGWSKIQGGAPGRERIPINVEYAGRLRLLGEFLSARGWWPPPPLTARRLLYWFAPHVPAAEIPLLPSLRKGRPAAAVWTRPRRRAPGAWVLFLWPSVVRLDPGDQRLWIGRVGTLRLRRLPLITLPGGSDRSARGVRRLARDLGAAPALRLQIVRTASGWPVLLVRAATAPDRTQGRAVSPATKRRGAAPKSPFDMKST
jgi:undecaprenyl-diphosphatase